MDNKKETLNNISRRYSINLLRAYSLLDIPSDTVITDVISEHIEEVLRASIVFMHAIVDDTLREIAKLMILDISPEELNEIPLVGISSSGQPKKFFLGELYLHRGKTVNGLIEESITEYLKSTSFNSISDIVKLLKRLDVDVSKLEKYFPAMDESINRRHKIVHQADMVNMDEQWQPNPISTKDVKKWLLGNGMFLNDLLSMLENDGATFTETNIIDDTELYKLKTKLSGLAEEAGVFDLY